MTVISLRDLDASWSYLEQEGYSPPRRQGQPFVPPAMPSHDDEELGLEFFRTDLRDASLASLTMPRTFFGRSRLERVDFRGSALHQSRLCWNDFIACDFSEADLQGSDLRASCFTRCSFARADLRGAELRRADFEACDFTGAQFQGARAPRRAPWLGGLSAGQRSELVLEAADADEPPGG